MGKSYNQEKSLMFFINNHDFIIIKSSDRLNEITCCDQASVTLVQNSKKYILDDGHFSDIREHMQTIKNRCAMVLENKLVIDDTVQSQLGKLYAHYSFYIKAKKKAQALGVVFDIKDWWDGYKYLLWSGDYALWMYNGSADSVTLECTPAYHGTYYYNIKGRTRYTEYKAYLENYHTLFTYKISKEKVHDWLSLAEKYIKNWSA